MSVFARRGTSASATLSNSVSTVSSNATAAEPEGLPKTSNNLSEILKKGIPHKIETSALAAIADLLAHKESLDDRKMLMEHILAFISELPEGKLSSRLNDAVIQLLYNDLPHPPPTMMGQQYAWRTADGSYNNISLPDMGKAGMPYARSVQQSHPLPPSDLPDPGLLFDTLLKRDGFVDHPAGCSSLMFGFGALVIHSVFRTRHSDPNINETSSYVDLSPLYGWNQEVQDKVRIKDGRGLLKPDAFAEDRILLLPPCVCVLLVVFNRNHNYIAKKLVEINEKGNLVDVESIKNDQKKLMAQEEYIFQTARLINVQWFATIVFSDYLSNILGMTREGSSWILNPFGEMRNPDHTIFERGRGNICSIEFNSLYRWHATASRDDTKWQDDMFREVFPDKSFDNITIRDFASAKTRLQASEPDISHWTFGHIDRQENGMFKDEDLARILHNATADPAGAFRARGIPASMRLHEIMGIEQNRKLGVCSMNDFRKYLGLKPFDSFREWNSDPAVADVAEKLYGHIENLELYVGLQAEEAKSVVPGAGLCPGYTMSRAILSDAVALTRGDRFFTNDYTPFNLTAWGFADSALDPGTPGFGGTLGKLFLRTLPNHFTPNSTYTWFPMLTPKSMKGFLTKLGKLQDYDLTKPGSHITPMRILNNRETITTLLKHPEDFTTPYSARASLVIEGKGFFTAYADASQAAKDQQKVLNAVVSDEAAMDSVAKLFYDKTRSLIQFNSYPLIGSETRAVDLVRDVLKAVPLYWAAEQLNGITITGGDHHDGDYTARELFGMLEDIYSFIFLDEEPQTQFVMQAKVKSHVEELLRHIRSNTGIGNQRSSVINRVSRVFSIRKHTTKPDVTRRLRDLGNTSDHFENSMLAFLVGSTVELSLALINMVDMFFEQSRATSSLGEDGFLAFAKQALATNPPFQGVYRVAQKDHNDVVANERVFLDIVAANSGANLQIGDVIAVDGLSACLGEQLTQKIMGEVLRAVATLDGVGRAGGRSGVLSSFIDSSKPMVRRSYLKNGATLSPWPASMVIQFEQSSSL